MDNHDHEEPCFLAKETLDRRGYTFKHLGDSDLPLLSKTHPNGQVNFDFHGAQVNKTGEKEFTLDFTSSEQKITFVAPTEAQVDEWVVQLHRHLKQSALNVKIDQDRFWKYAEIAEQEFLDTVQTGDMFFIRYRGVSVQKLLKGQFQHVAFVYRDAQNRIKLYEAVSGGVNYFEWSDVRAQMGKRFEKVGVRMLNVPRDE